MILERFHSASFISKSAELICSSREATAREEESAGKRDRFLLFLTCLASLSAVWDISCLLDELINYESAFSVANWGYRLFATLLLLLIVLVAWRSRKKK